MKECISVKNDDGIFIGYPNDAIIQHIQRGDLWEPHFTEVTKLIHWGDVVIDIGASFGYNSVVMGKKIGKNGQLISFEPQKMLFSLLQNNLLLNDIYSTKIYNKGVGYVIQSNLELSNVNYELDWVNMGATHIGGGGEKIDLITIDHLELDSVNFIKIDVEGFEYFTLLGGIETIQKYKPFIFIEIIPEYLKKFKCENKDIYRFLDNFGYSIYNILNDYPFDYICVPKHQKLLVDNLDIKTKLIEQW